jgi:hypothetical protein
MWLNCGVHKYISTLDIKEIIICTEYLFYVRSLNVSVVYTTKQSFLLLNHTLSNLQCL